MDNQMGMFHPDPASLGGMPPGGGGGANGQQQPPGAHHQHPQMQQMQQQQQQQPNHFNSNMRNVWESYFKSALMFYHYFFILFQVFEVQK